MTMSEGDKAIQIMSILEGSPAIERFAIITTVLQILLSMSGELKPDLKEAIIILLRDV